MRFSIRVAVGAAAIVAGTAAHGEVSLTQVRGVALVNRGSGFVRVPQPTRLSVGDRVAVNPGDGARLTYADGCVQNVVPGTMVVVGQDSPCALAQKVAQAPSEEQGPPPAALVGAGIAAVAIGGIILVSRDSDRPPPIPISP